MMKQLRTMFVYLLAAAAVAFSTYTFIKVAATSQAARPPELSDAPARVYGIVEPAGREAYVCPPVTRHVIGIWVAEGDTVKEGQRLCTLENSVELRELDLAQARIEAARKALEISTDELRRQRDLYLDEAVAEIDYTQARLKAELDSLNLTVAQEELKRARAVLEQLQLKAPISGIVYKLDIRLGETLTSGYGPRGCPIIIGPEDLWVRLYVESFWADRVTVGSTYKVYDSETSEYLGTGTVLKIAPYLTRRNFRTEDVRERFDTGYQEVVLELEQEKQNIPLGLSVVADLSRPR